MHVARRGTRGEAAALVRGIIANHDDRAHTAHDIAADTDQELLPARVASLLERPTHAVQARRAAYGTGKSRPRTCWLSSSGGSNSTSAAANTRASITGWMSDHRGITEKCGGPLGQGTADDCW
ncbi:hypothetical protein [Mycobacterium sp.]|uniref:hypothetical protein n=1 Tax=Mycobacterium sp. TaxID=1785 RepID=UPI003342AD83